MTVQSTENRVQFNGDGIVVAFPFTFKVFKTSEIQFSVDGVLQTEGPDYTVALAGSPLGDDGGTVTATIAPPTGTGNVVILRVLPFTQEIEFPTAGKFPPEANEEMGDRGVMLAQQLKEELDRSLTLAVTSPISGVELPVGAGKGFRWDSTATILQLVTLNDPGTINLIGAEGQIIQGGLGGVSETLPFGAEGDLLIALATKWGKLPLGATQGAAPVVSGSTLAYTTDPVITDPPGAGGKTFDAGDIKPTIRSTAPAGWLLCDGSEQNATAFEALFTEMVANIATFGLGSAVGTFTGAPATDIITLTAHSLVTDDVIHLSNSGGALPSGLSPSTKYFVINETTNTFQVSLTKGGSAVDFTDAGTGTHSAHAGFLLPDLRGRLPLGRDNMGSPAGRVTDPAADQIGDGAGAETHTLLESEMPSHIHTDNFRNVVVGADAGANAIAHTGNQGGNTGSTGGDQPHNNVQPYMTVNYIVKT